MKHLLNLTICLCLNLAYAQTKDAQGRKQGYWKKTDEKTGKLIYEGNFKDDQPVGTFKYYHINDSIKSIIVFNPDGKSAYATHYHMSGKRMACGKYSGKEIKDSVWTYYDEAGVLISRESYKAGKKQGSSYIYLPEGQVSEERNFRNGLEDGPYFEYYDKNVYKARGQYVNGEKEGRFIYYYPNGVEVANGFFKKGLKNGPWIYRSEDGKIKERELYRNGDKATVKETEAFFSKNRPTENINQSGNTQSSKKKP